LEGTCVEGEVVLAVGGGGVADEDAGCLGGVFLGYLGVGFEEGGGGGVAWEGVRSEIEMQRWRRN